MTDRLTKLQDVIQRKKDLVRPLSHLLLSPPVLPPSLLLDQPNLSKKADVRSSHLCSTSPPLLLNGQPGTKAQLKPTFPKDPSAKKEKKEDKMDDNDDDGTTTETDDRIRKWIATGDLRAQETGEHEMEDIQEEGEVSTPTMMPGSLPVPIPGTEGGSRGREMSTGSMRAASVSVPPGTRRINPTFAAPEGLEKVQLVVKWGGEVGLFIVHLFFRRSISDGSVSLALCSPPTPLATSPRTSAKTSRRTSRS